MESLTAHEWYDWYAHVDVYANDFYILSYCYFLIVNPLFSKSENVAETILIFFMFSNNKFKMS